MKTEMCSVCIGVITFSMLFPCFAAINPIAHVHDSNTAIQNVQCMEFVAFNMHSILHQSHEMHMSHGKSWHFLILVIYPLEIDNRNDTNTDSVQPYSCKSPE